MKRLLCLTLVLAVLAGVSLTPAKAYALENTASDTLYMITKDCPNGYIEYAASNIQGFIQSVDPSELPKTGTITVGTPFSFGNPDSDIFYFPVLLNGEIIYMLRVFPKTTGGYGGVLGKSFVSDLNAIASKTSMEQPLLLMMEDDSVVAYIGENRNVILEYPDGTVDCKTNINAGDFSKMYFADSSAYRVVNAVESNNQINTSLSVDEIASERVLRDSSAPSYKYLTTPITETQGDTEEWCAAYATAWIIRYVKGDDDDTEALDVMNYHFDNPVASDSIGEDEVVEYANSRSLYPTHITSKLSNSSLISQIVALNPVYLRMYRTVGTEKKYHAVVLRGYSNNTNKWSIWNPWYDYYDSFDMGGTYVPAEHQSREYTYCHTIYNW